MAEQLRRQVEAMAFSSDPKQPFRLTVSLGAAGLEMEEADEELFLRHVSEALHQAKEREGIARFCFKTGLGFWLRFNRPERRFGRK